MNSETRKDSYDPGGGRAVGGGGVVVAVCGGGCHRWLLLDNGTWEIVKGTFSQDFPRPNLVLININLVLINNSLVIIHINWY